jgi:hypothetical protein
VVVIKAVCFNLPGHFNKNLHRWQQKGFENVRFLQKRLPTRRDALFLFLISAFPIHFWAIVNLLRNIPALILRLSVTELIGVTAYTLVFALFESVLLLIVLIIISLVLPATYFKDKIVVRGFILVIFTSSWITPVLLDWYVLSVHQQCHLLWTILYFSILILLHFWLERRKNLEPRIYAIAKGVVTLSAIYVCFDAMSVVIVIIRNIL